MLKITSYANFFLGVSLIKFSAIGRRLVTLSVISGKIGTVDCALSIRLITTPRSFPITSGLRGKQICALSHMDSISSDDAVNPHDSSISEEN